jgi:DNA-binding XRE family transcriptional regulator
MDNEISTIDNLIKDYRLKLGDKIKLVREERGYSQEQLAVMDINRTTISKSKTVNLVLQSIPARFSICLDYEFKVIEK